jgi:hypothetical protein
MCWMLDGPLVNVRLNKHVLRSRRGWLAKCSGGHDLLEGAEGGELAHLRAGALPPRGPVPSLIAGSFVSWCLGDRGWGNMESTTRVVNAAGDLSDGLDAVCGVMMAQPGYAGAFGSVR